MESMNRFLHSLTLGRNDKYFFNVIVNRFLCSLALGRNDKHFCNVFVNRFFCSLTLVFLVCSGGFAQVKTAVEYFDEGIFSENAEDYYDASQHFMEAINLNADYADAWFHLSSCSYQLGEADLALSQLETAEKYSKNSDEINNLRGMIYISQGKLSEARAIFDGILKKKPNNIDARFGLAELDLFDGKITSAQKQYSEALKRQSQNRKALLSLAVISAEQGKIDKAKFYINQAISYYSGEAQVHYLAAVIDLMQNNYDEAERRCRIALELNGEYDKAYELLAKIKFHKKEYNEVVSICDFRILRNRNLVSAWYLKGEALKESGKIEDALNTWTKALEIASDDEVMRCAMELVIDENIPIEDARRKNWASYHTMQAKECENRYDKAGAVYEYQRALKIDPTNETARLAFADMLKLNGMNELYLEQLLFVRENASGGGVDGGENGEDGKNNQKSTAMNDTIEAYNNLLERTLSKKWNVEPFYLDKTRWSLGLYYYPKNSLYHVQCNEIASQFASEIFSGIASASVKTQCGEAKDFGDAFQKARKSGVDYFVILETDEGERDVSLSYAMYSARTGNKIVGDELYATANNRFANVFRRFRADILQSLTIRGKIIDRDGKTLLCDVGKSENIKNGAVFDVVKKNSISTARDTKGVSYKSSDVLGTFSATNVSEEISEGRLEFSGFYDKVNIGDEIVLVKMPDENVSSDITGNSPAATAEGNAVTETENRLLTKDITINRTPSFVELIRGIR